MGRFVIVAYRPRPDCEQALKALLARHMQVLVAEGLVSDRQACVMQAADGTLVEVFEWRSAEAIQEAHGNAAVSALWGEFSAVCDYVPLAQLAESQAMFAEFDATDP